jgi:hypothetical protein
MVRAPVSWSETSGHKSLQVRPKETLLTGLRYPRIRNWSSRGSAVRRAREEAVERRARARERKPSWRAPFPSILRRAGLAIARLVAGCSGSCSGGRSRVLRVSDQVMLVPLPVVRGVLLFKSPQSQHEVSESGRRPKWTSFVSAKTNTLYFAANQC